MQKPKNFNELTYWEQAEWEKKIREYNQNYYIKNIEKRKWQMCAYMQERRYKKSRAFQSDGSGI